MKHAVLISLCVPVIKSKELHEYMVTFLLRLRVYRHAKQLCEAVLGVNVGILKCLQQQIQRLACSTS